MRNQYPDARSSPDAETLPRGKSKMPEGRTANNVNGKTENEVTVEDEGPACQSCRKKKARCSRQQPCSHCVRFNFKCVYDERKMKPGLRTGAVENLSQRVDSLENMFLGQGILWQQVLNYLTAVQQESPAGLDFSPNEAAVNAGQSLNERTSQLKTKLSNMSGLGSPDNSLSARPPKRKRTNLDVESDEDLPPQSQPQPLAHDNNIYNHDDIDLPPDDLIDDLVEVYFDNIHPWIPILHARRFREQMTIPTQRRKLKTIFHAITSLCVRFSKDPRLSTADVRSRISKQSRDTVILQSMETFSVENLQALIICAFDTIGSGRGPSAWSIVGSMTRTVEQLQLSVEHEDKAQPAEFLIKRMAFLPAAESWIEREERRRVFWNVFLMDRFCSIATGWNCSLTSADVKRRLPCEGALWEEGNPLKTPTPYFGIADKSFPPTETLPTTSRPELEDQASLGGFAYCIEATESLSLVTTFSLSHAVNVSNVHNVQLWWMRFKELDLRLIQWKVFLPEMWREACALNNDGMLDPNLTLAHITHNTAVGLLHQGIAYPSPEWQIGPIRLPLVSSAETCLAAATEVAIIAEKYLVDSKSPTNAQFAFCLFISGRMLLAHTLHYNIVLPGEFDSLIHSLMEISRRWNGPHVEPGSKGAVNLASKFATRLIQARDQGPQSLDIRQSAYSEEQCQEHNHMSPKQQNTSQTSFVSGPGHLYQHPKQILSHSESYIRTVGPPMNEDSIVVDQEASPESISLAFPPLPSAFQPHNVSATQTVMPSPIPTHDQASHQPSSVYKRSGEEELGFQTTTSYLDPCNIPYRESVNGTSGFEDLYSFFGSSFLPTERITMFSNGVP